MDWTEIDDPALVAEALAHPQLRVRPPEEPVPKSLLGRPTGEVFALLLRMNDGDFHVRHRPDVEARVQPWARESVAAAAREAACDLLPRFGPNEVLSMVPVQTIARLLKVGVHELDATVDRVLKFTKAIAPGAGEPSIAAADEAVVALMAQGEALGQGRVAAANRIALMQQSADATAGLIGIVLLGEAGPAIVHTRRCAAQDLVLGGRTVRAGQVLVLMIGSSGHAFGAGPHACPGHAIALAITEAAVPLLAASGRFTRHTGWRPLTNVRIPVFQE